MMREIQRQKINTLNSNVQNFIIPNDTIGPVNMNKDMRAIQSPLHSIITTENDVLAFYDNKDWRICAFEASSAHASSARSLANYEHLEQKRNHFD
jgi:hypothetical protein